MLCDFNLKSYKIDQKLLFSKTDVEKDLYIAPQAYYLSPSPSPPPHINGAEENWSVGEAQTSRGIWAVTLVSAGGRQQKDFQIFS